MQKNKENLKKENGFESVSDGESTVDINTDDNVAGTNHLNETLEENDLIGETKRRFTGTEG